MPRKQAQRKLLVQRLWSLWNPVEALGLSPQDMRQFRTQVRSQVTKVPPLATFRQTRRGPKYHQGRIHYFMQCLKDGVELDPITIDNDCGNNLILPVPVVADGNHRLIAHVLMGKPLIRAHYDGRVDLLRYLEGKRKTPPRD